MIQLLFYKMFFLYFQSGKKGKSEQFSNNLSITMNDFGHAPINAYVICK